MTVNTERVIDVTDPEYGIPTDGTDAYEQLSDLFLKYGGARYYLGNACYPSTRPVPIDDGCAISGMDSTKHISGTILQIHKDASPDDWHGCGYFTSRNYIDDTVLEPMGETTSIEHCSFDGNEADFGGAILLSCSAQPRLANIRFRDFRGIMPMPERGEGIDKRQGSFLVCLTVFTINGRHGATTDNPNDPDLDDLRAMKCNGPLLWTDDDSRSQINDGRMRWNNPLIQDFSQAIGDQGIIDIAHSGGWRLDFPHLNGAGGHGIVLHNAHATAVSNGWLDGFGTGGYDGSAIAIDCTNGGTGDCNNSAVSIWGNTVRWRDEQAAGGQFVTLNARDNDVATAIFGNVGYIQGADVNEAVSFLFDLTAGKNGSLIASLTGNVFLGSDGTPWPKERLFKEALSDRVYVMSAGNSWDEEGWMP
jgi:hypothetical protein